MKVGNGSDNFNALPWLSAVAADVHAWAKKSEKEFKDWLVSAEGPALATTSQLAALDTRVGTAEGKIKTIEETTIPGLKSRLDAAEADIDNLQKAVGESAEGLGGEVANLKERMTAAEGTIAGHTTSIGENTSAIGVNSGNISKNTTAIENITKEGGTIDTKVKAEADRAKGVEAGLQTAIDTLNGADTVEGSVAKKVKDAVTEETNRATVAEAALGSRIDGVVTTAGNADTLSKANKALLDVLVPAEADRAKTVRAIAAEEINTLIGAADDEGGETIQKVADLVDYVEKNGGQIATLVSTVNDHGESITTLGSNLGTLSSRVDGHDTAIGTINTNAGTLADLSTKDKTSLVKAINETYAKIATDDATTLGEAQKYTREQIAALSGEDGVLTALSSRVTATETKLNGITSTVVAAIGEAETRAKEEAANKASAAQTAAISAAAADATTKANAAETNAKKHTDDALVPVNSAIANLQAFDKTAITGSLAAVEGGNNKLTMSLDGTALDIIFVCGGANIN